LQAVIPNEYESKIKVCAIVGGMSVEKQIRLLKYKPTIIVATPGRLWEMMSDHGNKYLLEQLPMIDVLVLDEADRMIADGHFKEMRDILAHIYTTRLRMKNALKNKQSEEEKAQQEELMELLKSKEEDEEVYEKDPNVDWSKVKDMFDEEELVKEIE
jgi:SpoVK/Ycf46/Vps4 family AAA+-type ATPase